MGWIVVTTAGKYRVNWRDPAGRQRAKTLRTKRDAKSFLAQVEADSARGTYVDPHAGQRALLRDFAAEWLDGRTVEVTTDERTRSILRAHILPRWGDWPLARIDHTSVQRWVRELSEIRAPATVAKCVNTLSLILASAVRSRLLTVNPCSGIRLPSAHRPTELVVTRGEFSEQLLPSVPPEHRGVVSAAAGCGLRWGECAGLPWSAVDLAGAELRVRQVAVELSGGVTMRAYPKTRAGVRTIPLPAFLLAELQTRFVERDPAFDLVFPTAVGTPLRRSNFRRQVWAPAVVESGLSARLRFHDYADPRVMPTSAADRLARLGS